MKKIAPILLVVFLLSSFAFAEDALPRGKSMGVTIDDWVRGFNEKLALLKSDIKITPFAVSENDGRLFYNASYADHMNLLFMCEADTEEVVGIVLTIQFETDSYEDAVEAGRKLPVALTAMVWACDSKLTAEKANQVAGELYMLVGDTNVGDEHVVESGLYRYKFEYADSLEMTFSARLIETEETAAQAETSLHELWDIPFTFTVEQCENALDEKGLHYSRGSLGQGQRIKISIPEEGMTFAGHPITDMDFNFFDVQTALSSPWLTCISISFEPPHDDSGEARYSSINSLYESITEQYGKETSCKLATHGDEALSKEWVNDIDLDMLERFYDSGENFAYWIRWDNIELRLSSSNITFAVLYFYNENDGHVTEYVEPEPMPTPVAIGF